MTMKLHVGASGYAYKEWKGPFYPEKIPSKDMLRFYSEHLSAVEINSTYYRMPTQKVLTSWAQQVPEDFVFTFKASQRITHIKRLKEVEQETEYLLTTLSALKERLGPILFQFPANFKVNRERLEGFLGLLPPELRCAFAFRSPSWIEDGILSLLRDRSRALCMEDTDEAPVGSIISTAPWGYLRLRRSDYSDDDLSEWVERILAQAWEKVYVFFKHENEAKAPLLAIHFRELFHAANPNN